MLEQIIAIAGSAISAALITTVVGKHIVKTATNDTINDLLEYINSEEGVKQIYMVGNVIGKGLIDGSGFQQLKPGKFKWQDLIGMIGIGLAKQYIPGLRQMVGEQEQPQLQPQPLNQKHNPYSK